MRTIKLPKRLSAILLTFFILMSCLFALPQVYAETAIVTVSAESAESARSLLSGINMLDAPASDMTTAFTRAEFAKLLADMMRYNDYAVQESGYRDVSNSMKNGPEMNFAIEQGYMVGEKGLFRPSDPVTFSEAARGFVELTGNNLAKRIQNESGYVMTASGLGIFKGINNSQADAPLSAGAVYKMAANTLSARSMKVLAVDGESVTEADSGNFLAVMHEVKKVYGVVTKTAYAGLYSAGGTGGKSVELDQIRFKSEEDWSKYLGYTVTAYVDYHGVQAEVLHLVPSDENEIISLVSEDIQSINNEKTEITYYVDENEETESLALSNETVVIWNGATAGTLRGFSIHELCLRDENGYPKTGSVRLIDHNSDGICDVMNIMSYDIYYVTDNDVNLERVMDGKAQQAITFSDFASNKTFMSYESGTLAEPQDITKMDILQVAFTRDRSMIHVIICENEQEVDVLEVRNGNEFRIGDVWYTGNDYFNRYYTQGSDVMTVGWHGYIKLDLNGRITYVRTRAVSETGYLVNISKPIGLDTETQGKFFTDYESDDGNHAMKILDFADKVSVDSGLGMGYQLYDEEDVRGLDVFNSNGEFKHQLVKFKVNTEGEVNYILTANRQRVWDRDDFYNSRSDDVWYNDYSEFALNYDAAKDGPLDPEEDLVHTKCMYFQGNTVSRLGNGFAAHEDDLLFWAIPADITDEKAFGCGEAYQYTIGSEYPDIKVYNLKEDGSFEHVVWTNPGSTAKPNWDPKLTFFVSDVQKIMSEDGTITNQISGYRTPYWSDESLQQFTFTATEPEILEDIAVGDVIHYLLNARGLITNIEILFSYQNRTATENGNLAVRTRPLPLKAEDSADYNQYFSPEGVPYWGKVLYDTNRTVALTFKEEDPDTYGATDFGQEHQTFIKSENFKWVMHDVKTGKTWTEQRPVISSVRFGVEESPDVLMIASYLNCAMGVIYLNSDYWN